MSNIKKLKDLRLQLIDIAIQGKLVEQRAEEGSAQELFDKIQKEKQDLIKAGKLKKEKALPEISDDEIPFEIPESWKWVRLSTVISLVSGRDLELKQILDKESYVPYITGASQITDTELIISRWTDKPISISRFGDILISCKGTVGKVIINSVGDIHIARQIMAIRNLSCDLSSKYVKYFIIKNKKNLQNKAVGLIPGISREDILNLCLPLPPLEEQKRIVEKLESYLNVIDRAIDLLERKAKLDEVIKQKILQMAIQGKLVEQRTEEGSAQELFDKIQKEKQELIKAGKLKKEKALPEISDDEIPFEIPESWKWFRIGQLVEPAKQTSPTQRFRYIDVSAINNKTKKIENLSEYSHDKAPSRARRVVQKGMVLFSTVRPYYLNTVIYQEEIKNLPVFASTAFASFMCKKNVFNKYLWYTMQSPFFFNYVTKTQRGASYPAINEKDFYSGCVPIPPLEEQKRIVAKVEQLFSLIDKMSLDIDSSESL